ncbi:MAG: META domain-containing protein [Candidatus Nanopelagicales bacterium]
MRTLRRTSAVLVALVAAAVVLTGCGSSASPENATTGSAAADLTPPTQQQMQKKWSVLALPLKPGASEQKVTFTASDMSTSDGCNQLTGPYTLGSDGAFKLGTLAGTQVACDKPADTRHVDALKAATKVGLDNRSGYDQLVFTDSSGALVLVLQDSAGD